MTSWRPLSPLDLTSCDWWASSSSSAPRTLVTARGLWRTKSDNYDECSYLWWSTTTLLIGNLCASLYKSWRTLRQESQRLHWRERLVMSYAPRRIQDLLHDVSKMHDSVPSFSAAPSLRCRRSVINLASGILNLAPPGYRFFFISSDTFEFRSTWLYYFEVLSKFSYLQVPGRFPKFVKVRILNLVIFIIKEYY